MRKPILVALIAAVVFVACEGNDKPTVPTPIGSCCAPDGSCTATTQANCSTTWTQGSVCTPNPCPQPLPEDLTPPAAVMDLTTMAPTGYSITLRWTAVGDDSLSGTAEVYDIRYTNTEKTPWEQMPGVLGEPLPQAAGQAEMFTVVGLSSDTTYLFYMKVADEVPHWSGISNLAVGGTLDATPPGPVTDFRVSASSDSSITLTWTATGDDGTEGQASSYHLRYTDNPGAPEQLWVLPRWPMPHPKPAGETETYVVDGLQNNRVYYFVLTVCDEASNWTAPSNEVSGSTRDAIPPGAVLDLVLDIGQSGCVLTWTAPGDDGYVGTASGLDLRHSVDCAASWDSMTRVTFGPGTWTAQPAGSREELHLPCDIPDGGCWFFTLSECDEAGNWSPVSNRTSTCLWLDPITDLAVVSSTGTGITLTWTAPAGGSCQLGVAQYEVRYATDETTEWESMTSAAGEPEPGSPGSEEIFTVTGLQPGTGYWFRMVVRDEAGDPSRVSNVAFGSTLP
jgi:hypothetical protein